MSDKHNTQEEDDVVIDLSKVKNWFSGKKKHGHEHHAEHKHQEHKHESHKHTEHKHTEHKTEHHESKSDDAPLDIKAVIPFFKKYGTIFLILIPVILTIFIRLQPMYLPATDNWAESTVYNYYRNQIASQVNTQYPNLPDANKNALIIAEFDKFVQQNEQMLEQQVAATSQGFKDRLMYTSGDSSYVYLGDIDSYFWLRGARKLIETGSVCDEIDYENNICYPNTYTIAPIKTPIELGTETASPYVYSIVYTYKVMKLFDKDITVMQASFYVPLIYAILSAILAFLIGKMMAGNLAGVVTSIIISVNPIYLSRTLGSDNDPQNMFYPLLIVFLFLYTLESKDLKRTIIFGFLTGLGIGLFAWAWQGWWFIFDFIVGALGLYIGFQILQRLVRNRNIKGILSDRKLRWTAVALIIIFISSGIFVSAIDRPQSFKNAIAQPLWFMKTKEAAQETYWPNVLVTVAEFNPGSLGQIVSQMGGKLLFFLGLMGTIFVILRKEEKLSKNNLYLVAFGILIYLILVSQYGTSLSPMTYMALLALPVIAGLAISLKSQEADVKVAILLIIWFVATTYAALKGVRFTMLMVGAFGVAYGVTIAMIYKFSSRWVSRELKINETITKCVIAAILLLTLIAPLKAGYVTAQNFIPSVNDAWYDSLTNIRDNSEPDAIINSWWDFGHWFKFIADRRVSLDGSSQGGQPLHWLGKLMTTSDERRSMGILRMLDCGSYKGFEELDNYIKDTPNSIKVLDRILVQDNEKAEATLRRIGLDDEQIAGIMQYTHCEPPENFFITSEDMVGKAGVWSHFGSWDFAKAEMYNKVKGKSIEEGKAILSDKKFNLTEEQIDQYYYEIQTEDGNQWISPWPGYISQPSGCQGIPTELNRIICVVDAGAQRVPFEIDLNSMEATFETQQGTVRPSSLVYVTNEGVEEKKFTGDVLGASLVLIPSGTTYKAMLVHPVLANSVFTKLFYLEGHGLRYFDKFSDKTGVTGGRIIVWKVDWNGTDPNIAYARVEPDVTALNETISTDDAPDEQAATEETEETIEEEALESAEIEELTENGTLPSDE